MHLPVAVLFDERTFRWSSFLHAKFDLSPSDPATTGFLPAIGDDNDIFSHRSQGANHPKSIGPA
jgi:hypothetical protein